MKPTMNTAVNTSTQSDTALILLGHGSRDPLWRGPIEALAARISLAAPDMAVCCAYLEWVTPDVVEAVQGLVAQGHTHIRLLPLFFGMGKHAREDLPALVQHLREQHPQLQLRVLASAGEQGAVLDLLARLALTSDPSPIS